MVVKGNQPALHEKIRLFFTDPAAPADQVDETVDGDHGRIEERRAEVLHDVAWLAKSYDWPGLTCLGKVTARREIASRLNVGLGSFADMQ